MYWRLLNHLEDEENDAYITGNVNFVNENDIYFNEGVSLQSVNIPKIVLKMDEDSQKGRMTDHLVINEVQGLVFSAKIRNLLADLGINNIEYFDFEIINPKTGEIFSDYKIANIVGLVDCVDHDKSILKYFNSGRIKRIKRLVLNESKIPSAMKIFRLVNRSTAAIAHNDIKEAIYKSGVTGCVFTKLG